MEEFVNIGMGYWGNCELFLEGSIGDSILFELV